MMDSLLSNLVRVRKGIVFFGGWLFSLPLIGLSMPDADTSKISTTLAHPMPGYLGSNNLVQDSLNVSRLPVALVEGTLLNSVVWERQPYRTAMQKTSFSTGSDSRTAPELLMNVTGILVQKTNHGGGSPTLRGLQGNQTLMLVDGVRLNNSIFRYGPNQYFNTLDALGLDQIEVLFGHGAVQYGSDAMSGALLAKYHEPSRQNLNKVMVHGLMRGMSAKQEFSRRVSMDYATKKMGFTVGGTIRDFGDVVAGGSQKSLAPTAYRERDLDAKFQWYGKGGTLTIAHQNNNQFDVPVYHKVTLENYAFYQMDLQLRSLTYVRKEWHKLGRLVEKIELTGGWQSQSEWRSFQKNSSNVLRREKDSVDTRFVTVKLFGFQRRGWQYVAGIDGYFDQVFSQRRDVNLEMGTETGLRALYPNKSHNDQISAFAYTTKSTERSLLRLGARFSGSRVRIPTVELGDVVDDNQAVVFDVSASHKLLSNLVIYSNVGSSYRSPNIDDLGTLGIVDFRFEVPQYDLKPEYSLNKELGLKWKGESSMASVSLYHNALSGLITRVKSPTDSLQGYPVYYKQNTGLARIQGAELDFYCVMGKRFRLKGGAFVTVGDNLSRNEPMRRIPPVMTNLQSSYRINDQQTLFVTIHAAAPQKRLAQGDVQDNRIGPAGTAGYVVGDLRWRCQKKRIYMDLAVANVGNALYKTHGSGVFMPGRSLQFVVGF